MTLGQKIKIARKELNLTQSEVAGEHITRAMLSKIESGSATPSIETIEYIAKRLGRPISYFLDDVNSTGMDYLKKSITEEAFEHSSFLIKNKEFKAAEKYLMEFISIYGENDKDFFYARIIYNLGVVSINLKKNSEALDQLYKALKYFKLNLDFYYLSKAYYKIGTVHYWNKDFAIAEDFFQNAILHFEKSYIEDVLYDIQCHYNLGNTCYSLGKFDEALEALLKALKLSRDYKCTYDEGKIQMIMGVIYIKKGEIERAIKCTQEAISFFSYMKENDLKAASLKNLGNMQMMDGKIEAGIINLERAMQYYEKKKNYVYVYRIKMEIFEALISNGYYDRALNYSYTISLEHMPSGELVSYYENMRNVHSLLGNKEKAEEYAEKLERYKNTDINSAD